MTLWNDFTAAEIAAIEAAVVDKCEAAAGGSMGPAKKAALAALFGSAVASYAAAGVRCIYDPEDGVPGIVAAGTPYLPAIVGVLRNSDGDFVPLYGRKTSSETINKTGTEQVSIKPAATADLDERITVAVPDVRAANVGNVEASDVDAAEKLRFDAEAEKSLFLLLGKWVRRASVPEDL